jgi:eukaryotic-like serine/threonine-protein kinase
MRTVSEPELPPSGPSDSNAAVTELVPMLEAPGAQPGDRIGRYVVIRLLGSGGMGMVYLADDPRLDRRIAIKILRGRSPEEPESDHARQRLLREAQAIARLSHPNVVAIHDVGTHRDGVFIAMEYVEGVSLRSWIREREPKLGQIIDVFIGAARGLSAAHAANIVHRDVKPDNIIVDDQLHAKVLDFGLARSVREASLHADARAPMEADDDNEVHAKLAVDMTAVGHIMGTPPYMSPEQARGLPLTARTDQYSLCVALYEAVYGVRPFVGRSATELASARKKGPKFPEHPTIPRALRRIIERALQPDPEHRFDSMDAVVRELNRYRHRQRRTTALIVVVAVMSAAMSFAGARWLDEHSSCAAIGDLDSWSASRRAALERTFIETGSHLAHDSWPHVRQELDAFASAWSSARQDACEDTVLHGEHSGASMDLRLTCLDRKRQAFDALVQTFESADLQVVAKATQAVQQLPELTECADLAALALLPPTPEPGLLATVEMLRGDLALAEARRHSGRYDEAQAVLDTMQSAVAEAAYLPLVGEYELQRARVSHELANRADVEASLRRALEAAEQGHYPPLRVDVLMDLAFELGAIQKRFDAAEAVLAVARAAALSVEDPPDIRARRRFVRAEILLARDRFEDARHIYEELSSVPSRVIEPDVVLERLASTRRTENRTAQQELRQVLLVRERRFGRHHPRVADALLGLGARLVRSGEHDEARASFERALAIREVIFGPKSAEVAKVHSSLGAVAIKVEDYESAIAHLERAVDVATGDPAAIEFDTASILSNLGIVYSRLGQQEKARELHRRALTTMERADADHPRRVVPIINIAASHQRDDEYEEAIVWFKRAQSILIEHNQFSRAADMAIELAEAHVVLGDHETSYSFFEQALQYYEMSSVSNERRGLVLARLRVAEAYFEQRRPQDAIVLFERALEAERSPRGQVQPLMLHARLGLARALVATGERRRAGEVARQGLEHIDRLGPDERQALGHVEMKLRRHAR